MPLPPITGGSNPSGYQPMPWWWFNQIYNTPPGQGFSGGGIPTSGLDATGFGGEGNYVGYNPGYFGTGGLQPVQIGQPPMTNAVNPELFSGSGFGEDIPAPPGLTPDVASPAWAQTPFGNGISYPPATTPWSSFTNYNLGGFGQPSSYFGQPVFQGNLLNTGVPGAGYYSTLSNPSGSWQSGPGPNFGAGPIQGATPNYQPAYFGQDVSANFGEGPGWAEPDRYHANPNWFYADLSGALAGGTQGAGSSGTGGLPIGSSK